MLELVLSYLARPEGLEKGLPWAIRQADKALGVKDSSKARHRRILLALAYVDPRESGGGVSGDPGWKAGKKAKSKNVKRKKRKKKKRDKAAEPPPRLTDRSASVDVQIAKILDVIGMRTSDRVSAMPVVLYLDDVAGYAEVRPALEAVLAAFDQELILSGDPVEGSIWQAFVSAVKRQADGERLDQAGDALTAGLKARLYNEPMSQITKAQGEAIANLLNTLQNTQNALLAFSNILIVKIDGVPLVRELTPEQVEHLQKNPRLYSEPRLALTVLDVATGEPVGDGSGEPGSVPGTAGTSPPATGE